MKFVCANANLIQGVNLDADYNYITAKAKSHVLAIETLANSFAKSKSDCVLFVWDTDDPNDLVRATEQASLENINFKEVIDELKHYIDFSVLGDFDFKTFELENGMTISIVKYVTMNNFRESKKSTRKSIRESVEFFNDWGTGVYCATSSNGWTFCYCPLSWINKKGVEDLIGWSVMDDKDRYIEGDSWENKTDEEINDSIDNFEKLIKKYAKEDAKEIIEDFRSTLDKD